MRDLHQKLLNRLHRMKPLSDDLCTEQIELDAPFPAELCQSTLKGMLKMEKSRVQVYQRQVLRLIFDQTLIESAQIGSTQKLPQLGWILLMQLDLSLHALSSDVIRDFPTFIFKCLP